MKLVYVGLALLCTLTLACAVTGNPSTDPQSTQATPPSGQPTDGQISTPAPAPGGQDATILSREEAEAMRVQGDSLLTHSAVGDINVGDLGNDKLIYILVVVLLVVVILAVAL